MKSFELFLHRCRFVTDEEHHNYINNLKPSLKPVAKPSDEPPAKSSAESSAEKTQAKRAGEPESIPSGKRAKTAEEEAKARVAAATAVLAPQLSFSVTATKEFHHRSTTRH